MSTHSFSGPIGHVHIKQYYVKGANGTGVVVAAMVKHRLVDARLLQVNNVYVRSVLNNYLLAI